MRCAYFQHEDGILYECTLDGDIIGRHNGAHQLEVALLTIPFESLPAKAIAAIAADLNTDPKSNRYSEQQIRLAVWRMLGDMVFDLAAVIESLPDDAVRYRFRGGAFERALGKPELPPALADAPCVLCGQPIGAAHAASAVDTTPDAENFAWAHESCVEAHRVARPQSVQPRLKRTQ